MNYDNILNKTITEIKPSGIRKFFDIASSMRDVISLGVGEPDFPTPWKIRNEAIRTLERGKTRYSSNSGLSELREEIARYMERKFALSYDPEGEVLVTIGGSEAIDACVRVITNPGDEIIIPQPSYVCYEPIVQMAGGVPIIIETKAENDFKVTPTELAVAISPRTKALILPYPCNPTGAIMEKGDLVKLAEVLRGTDILVLSDEIYAELTFGELSHVSPAAVEEMKERTVVINGFSKAFSMTGWRLGFACGPRDILRQMTKLHQFAIMCAPTTSQYAAVEALRTCDEEVAEMMAEYDMRRRIMVDGFCKIGLPCREPKGAFYAFPCISSTGMTSDEFCEKLLHAKHVALVPGTAFGQGGEGFVRASYCYSTDHIHEALRRVGEFLEELK
ncbi:MAG: aminotransferase class I/II-fold pyridoxal phosphate-dependent enzyme [Clostridia bacterium]|nr:aminotransferase class I/II-fold pyridoxal phosphate-dependent enzyme [Clostridia bacterium]